jgi:hypothetical protein
MEEQEKYQQMLNALSDEDRLKLRNALEDLDNSLLETSMEDLEGFVKEKYPNAKIVQGNVVEDGQIIGKTTDLYKENAYDNFIEELYDEQFQKSLGIEPNSNILPEGELKDKTFVDDGVTYSIENVDPLDDFNGPAYDAQTMDRDIPNQIDEDYAKLLQENSIVDGDIVDMDDIDKPITDVDNYLKNNLADNVATKNLLRKTITNRIKSLAIGGLNMLDAYELGLIGAALIEPAVQKALKPIMPLILPGYKGKVDSKTYGEQVIENLQATAKISPTAKVAEKIDDIPKPQTQELTGMGWVGKMLDR